MIKRSIHPVFARSAIWSAAFCASLMSVRSFAIIGISAAEGLMAEREAMRVSRFFCERPTMYIIGEAPDVCFTKARRVPSPMPFVAPTKTAVRLESGLAEKKEEFEVRISVYLTMVVSVGCVNIGFANVG